MAVSRVSRYGACLRKFASPTPRHGQNGANLRKYALWRLPWSGLRKRMRSTPKSYYPRGSYWLKYFSTFYIKVRRVARPTRLIFIYFNPAGATNCSLYIRVGFSRIICGCVGCTVSIFPPWFPSVQKCSSPCRCGRTRAQAALELHALAGWRAAPRSKVVALLPARYSSSAPAAAPR